MTTQGTIREGDRFVVNGHTWEVIRVIPGGRLDLFDKDRCYFSQRYHREVRTWERVTQ